MRKLFKDNFISLAKICNKMILKIYKELIFNNILLFIIKKYFAFLFLFLSEKDLSFDLKNALK